MLPLPLQQGQAEPVPLLMLNLGPRLTGPTTTRALHEVGH